MASYKEYRAEKGFVLTLDALFAVLLMTVFLVTITFSFQIQPNTPWLSKTGYDFLTALDKGGSLVELTVTGSPQTLLQNLVNKLPVHMGGKLSINIYEYKNEQFTLDTSLSATKGAIKNEKVVTKRVFTNVAEDYYGVIQLEIWYE